MNKIESITKEEYAKFNKRLDVKRESEAAASMQDVPSQAEIIDLLNRPEAPAIPQPATLANLLKIQYDESALKNGLFYFQIKNEKCSYDPESGILTNTEQQQMFATSMLSKILDKSVADVVKIIHATEKKELKKNLKVIDLNIPKAKRSKTASAEKQFSKNYHFSDLGNAERIYDKYGDTIDYVHELGKFAIFDGSIHVVDESGKKIHKIYKTTLKEMIKEASTIEDGELQETALKWCRNSEFYKTYANTLAHLTRLTAHRLSEYDADDYSIPCLNGILDLKKFTLRPASAEDKHLKVITVNYIPDAKCPRFIKFISEITGKDGKERPELVNYLHKILGYCLIADTSEKCIFFFYGGTGDNGKSTLIFIVEHILGPFAQRISSSSLMEKQNSNEMRNDLAKLIGARFVAGSEISKNKTFDDGLIRDLVGGDAITCRFLRKEFFTYTPVYKLFLYGNNKPRISADDPAIKNKIKMIPFDFQPAKKDKNLKRVLKSEAEGIFAWMVEGLKKYYKEGLDDPEEISETTKEYFLENDMLGRFLSEKYELTNSSDDYVTKKELYGTYIEWIGGENLKALSISAIGRRLKNKNFKEKPVKIEGKTVKCWMNIKEKSIEDEENAELNIPF